MREERGEGKKREKEMSREDVGGVTGVEVISRLLGN